MNVERFGDEQRPEVIARELMLTDLSPQAQAAIGQALEARRNSSQPSDSTQIPENAQAEYDDTAMQADSAGAGAGGAKKSRVPALGLLPAKPVPEAMMIAGLTLGSPDFQRR